MFVGSVVLSFSLSLFVFLFLLLSLFHLCVQELLKETYGDCETLPTIVQGSTWTIRQGKESKAFRPDQTLNGRALDGYAIRVRRYEGRNSRKYSRNITPVPRWCPGMYALFPIRSSVMSLCSWRWNPFPDRPQLLCHSALPPFSSPLQSFLSQKQKRNRRESVVYWISYESRTSRSSRHDRAIILREEIYFERAAH